MKDQRNYNDEIMQIRELISLGKYQAAKLRCIHVLDESLDPYSFEDHIEHMDITTNRGGFPYARQ